MQGCAPLYLRELLVKQANTRNLRSNTKNLLQIPHTNLKKFGDRALCVCAPRLWNELPDKTSDSVQNFKKHLKTLLFDYMDHTHLSIDYSFKQSLFDYMDHTHLSIDYSFKALLNIIGGKGAISNINYVYIYLSINLSINLSIYLSIYLYIYIY